MIHLFSHILPFASAFAAALVLTLILTPLVREMNRFFGMVDKPSARRINTTPIPRGGGLALVLGVFVSYSVLVYFTGWPLFPGFPTDRFVRLMLLALGVTALGYADDRFGLSPHVKLAGQVVVAFLTWWWAGLGFARLWPGLPVWIDCGFTMFWIVGAINAFNLIDGLDGLASGIGLIATLGIAGSLLLNSSPCQPIFYFAFAGGLLGFLRYNYNPASVFLGDSGSMFIGFMLSTLPLISQESNSVLVSVGVPLLAMGVPIFDTALAILRRSIRHLLFIRERDSGGSRDDIGNDKVMSADTDHLHHRILRASGLNQRKAAWTLYLIALFLVLTGLCGIFLESKSAGLWLFAVAVAAVVIFRNLARIELFDAGQLLNAVAHNRNVSSRRRWAKMAVPFYLTVDLAAVALSLLIIYWMLHIPLAEKALRIAFPIRIISVFVCLCFFRTYVTVWSRAVSSNFVRLFLACVFGTVVGSIGLYLAPQITDFARIRVVTFVFPLLTFVLLLAVRIVRSVVRDLFYALDCSRLKARKDVSRVLVYGAGLRYRAFRRELVRSTSANDRMIVGILDDDLLLRGHYIGGIRVLGTINQAPEVINQVNADTVVIACDLPESWMKVVLGILEPTGVKITHFSFSEKVLKP